MASGELRPYDDYKPSGVEWLGDAPAHWEVRRLKYVLHECDSRSVDGKEQLLRVSQYTGVTRRLPQDTKKEYGMGTSSLIGYKIVEDNDLVINIMLAWNGSMGVSKFRGITSPAYCVYRFTSHVMPWYFHYLLRSFVYMNRIREVSTGIVESRLRLYTDDLFRLEALVPPLPEQIAIARFLDRADRRVRRFIRAREKTVALLEDYKRAVVHRAVAGRFDVRTGRPYLACEPSGVPWLGDVPAHWEVRRLKTCVRDVIDLTSGRGPADIYVALEHVESWTGKIVGTDSDVSFESQVKRFLPNDVLFGKLRPYLAKTVCADRQGVCVGEFLVLRSRNSELAPEYLGYWLRSEPMIDAIDASTFGAKMPRADWRFIGSMGLSLPPLEEQTAIARFLDETLAGVDGAIDRARRQIALLREYRTRLIADAATGRIDVRAAAAALPDDDGRDEPAPDDCGDGPGDDAA